VCTSDETGAATWCIIVNYCCPVVNTLHGEKSAKGIQIASGSYQGGHKPGKPGILRDFSEHGKLWEFCATSGKIVTNNVFLVHH